MNGQNLHDAINKLRRVVEDHGSHPEYHKKVAARLQSDWPLLIAAIDNLLLVDSRESAKDYLKENTDVPAEMIAEWTSSESVVLEKQQ